MFRRSAKGFTLTELAIVLGVIGLILGAIWTAASVVYDQRKTAQAVAQITQLSSNIRALYQLRGSFTQAAGADISSALLSANAYPNDMAGQLTGGYPTNPWGGSTVVTVVSATVFRIAYNGTPAKACFQLISQLIGNAGTSAAPVNFRTDSGGVSYSLANGSPTSQTVSTDCAGNGNGTGAASTEFDYSLR